jgi:redox-sensitive bicupin YhaK (pirin superfamily)
MKSSTRRFTRTGGELKMIQLWVNLPAKDKMTHPGYQSITADVIPDVALPDGAGRCGLLPALRRRCRPCAHLLAAERLGYAAESGPRHHAPQPEGWSTRWWCWKVKSRSTAPTGP